MKIPTKDQLIEDLEKSFNDTIDWVNNQPESHFNEEMISGKWTIAGHIYHLIKTTKAVSKGMAMPKLGLRTMFGKNNRQERTYDEIVEKYENALTQDNIKVPGNYEAKADRTFKRASLLDRYEQELHDFIKALGKWKEEDMSVYVLPHPLIGKCTIREFTYFTILHNDHHLNVLKERYVK